MSKPELTKQDTVVAPVTAAESSTTSTPLQYEATFTKLITAASETEAQEGVARLVAMVNSMFGLDVDAPTRLRTYSLENVTPGWCSYCGKPLDRCPCGAIDHWNENLCPKCGPKPDDAT